MSISKKSELILKVCSLQNKLLKRLDQSLMVHGISVTEFIVMLHLSNAVNKNMRRIDLAERVGLSASGVTRLLNPMQKIGLVEKGESTRDARVSLIKLSSSGENIFRDAEVTFDQCTESFMAPLNEKQSNSLAIVTQLLLKN